MAHEVPSVSSRRSFLWTLAGAAGAAFARPSSEKPLRGIFVIVATPYNESNAVDCEDLAHEVEWLNRCGTDGMVWPQMASEYNRLTVEERLRGFEVIADAAKGKPSAVVFGVQGPDTNAALNYLRHAEKLSPDALIAIPPENASSLEDYRSYYGALARATERPIFIQDTGPHHPLPMPVPFMLELAGAYPNLGYVKEEISPVLDRMRELQSHRPPMKRVFSGDGGRGMLAEMGQGSDGTMPTACFTVFHAPAPSDQPGRTGRAGLSTDDAPPRRVQNRGVACPAFDPVSRSTGGDRRCIRRREALPAHLIRQRRPAQRFPGNLSYRSPVEKYYLVC